MTGRGSSGYSEVAEWRSKPCLTGEHRQGRAPLCIQIQAGQHLITAAGPIPDDRRHATDTISGQPEPGPLIRLPDAAPEATTARVAQILAVPKP